jgi:hypothetical protein
MHVGIGVLEKRVTLYLHGSCFSAHCRARRPAIKWLIRSLISIFNTFNNLWHQKTEHQSTNQRSKHQATWVPLANLPPSRSWPNTALVFQTTAVPSQTEQCTPCRPARNLTSSCPFTMFVPSRPTTWMDSPRPIAIDILYQTLKEQSRS